MRQNRESLRALCLAVALVVPGAALAEALQLPPEIDALYSATLKEGQVVAPSTDGCGWVVPNVKILLESKANDTWDGACHEGLALGPGTLTTKKDGKLVSTTSGWALRGRFLGLITIGVNSESVGGLLFSYLYSWKGTSYSWTKFQPPPLGPSTPIPDVAPIRVSFGSPDPARSVSYQLNGPRELVMTRDTEAYRRTGNFADRITRYPCANGCGDLWAKTAGPLMEERKAFYQATNPEIEAIQASVEPVLQPLLKHMAEKKKLEAQARADQLRAANLTLANRDGRVVDSRSLDQLIRQTLGERR